MSGSSPFRVKSGCRSLTIKQAIRDEINGGDFLANMSEKEYKLFQKVLSLNVSNKGNQTVQKIFNTSPQSSQKIFHTSPISSVGLMSRRPRLRSSHTTFLSHCSSTGRAPRYSRRRYGFNSRQWLFEESTSLKNNPSPISSVVRASVLWAEGRDFDHRMGHLRSQPH